MRSATALDVAARKRPGPDSRPNNILSTHVAFGGISAIVWQRLSDRARFDHSSCNGKGEIDKSVPQSGAEALEVRLSDVNEFIFSDVNLVVGVRCGAHVDHVWLFGMIISLFVLDFLLIVLFDL